MYRCLEATCQLVSLSVASRIEFFSHMESVHGKRFNIQTKLISQHKDLTAWLRFIFQHFLPGLSGYHDGMSASYSCCIQQTSARCTAFLISILEQDPLTERLRHKVLFCGDHYGHPHEPTVQEQHFLLDYNFLSVRPPSDWIRAFKNAGRLLCRFSAAQRSVTVMGFATEQQRAVLRSLHDTIVVYELDQWTIFFSTIQNGDGSMKLLPVAYLYSAREDAKILAQFLMKLNGISNGAMGKTAFVVSNFVDRLQMCWRATVGKSASFIHSPLNLINLFSEMLIPSIKVDKLDAVVRSCAIDLEEAIDNTTPRDSEGILLQLIENLDTYTAFDSKDWDGLVCVMDILLRRFCDQIEKTPVSLPGIVCNSGNNVRVLQALLEGATLPKVMSELMLFSVAVLDGLDPVQFVSRQARPVAVS